MSTTAQILANRRNAEFSHGPVTVAGKERVSRNATQFGLFSVANFVRPEEQETFDRFESGYLAELVPETPLEQTLAREIVQAAWRLRRCASLEAMPPMDLDDDALDRLQLSIDRARSAAQRTFHRSLKELRRLQGERLYATFVAATPAKQTIEPASQVPAKQTQSEPPKTDGIPRSAQCPCKSGQKFKRCCGRNAPPVLTKHVAA